MSRQRTFFLESTPEQGPARLVPADQEQALKVLRVQAGTRLLGVDGRGRAWELEVVAADRRRLELASLGPARQEPSPGTPGAALPWIEVCTPLPKGGRAEAMLGPLTQLGLARLVPLVTEHTDPQARSLPENRRTRLERAAQEAVKQSGRLWMPEIAHPETLASLLKKPATRIVLDPAGASSLSQHLGSLEARPQGTREKPIQLLFGPEGGLSGQEIEELGQNGAIPVRLAAHILRIETAAQAALAILAERCLD